MMEEKRVIELKNVEKHYHMGEEVVKAVDGISIKIEKGDFVAIMGPSGSGKSTAMNLVGSLDLATKGEIYLDGIDIENLEESELAQIRGRKIGFIFQSFNLIPNLTAKENVMLPMIFQDVSEEERNHKAQKLLKLVELNDRMDHYPNELSGGQQQRVAIARALANEPEVILADEPTGNLDPASSTETFQLLERINQRGTTVLVATHNQQMVNQMKKRVINLNNGRVVSDVKSGTYSTPV